jgi:hypothetical protein
MPDEAWLRAVAAFAEAHIDDPGAPEGLHPTAAVRALIVIAEAGLTACVAIP